MDDVQEWLNAGGNGRGKRDEGDRGEGGDPADGEIVNGLVDRLARGEGTGCVGTGGDMRAYLDDDLDLPGLDVPERGG